MERIRVQKYLSQKGLFSRRQVEDFIRQKRLKINGKLATLGDKVAEGDRITLDGKDIKIPSKIKRVLIAYYKPVGVEVTLKKLPHTKTLADIDFGVGRVFPVGRLDKASRGLLLLTNDGERANYLMHPRYQKEKHYIVTVDRPLQKKDLQQMAEGVMLSGKMTSPCNVEPLAEKQFKIILKEGRNRQIRRMCEACGYKVLDLFRTQIGDIRLEDLSLKPGNWKILEKYAD